MIEAGLVGPYMTTAQRLAHALGCVLWDRPGVPGLYRDEHALSWPAEALLRCQRAGYRADLLRQGKFVNSLTSSQ